MIHKDKELSKICHIIKSQSGICVSGAHLEFLCSYIQKRITELSITCEKYIMMIQTDSQELTRLINQSTINETYFFREEKQFLYVVNHIFPLFRQRPITIWSAACSTGEEILSLAMLCEEYGITARLYGTDIDSNALGVLEKREYNTVSIRTDGTVFHPLLNKYAVKEDASIIINKEIADKIKRGTFNLHTFSGSAEIPPDGTIDIIFLRNVFIYFDDETRSKIISFMEKKLSPQGLLFFSMSEIASIIPDKKSALSKQKHEVVYFLQKNVKNKSLEVHSASVQDKKNTLFSSIITQKRGVKKGSDYNTTVKDDSVLKIVRKEGSKKVKESSSPYDIFRSVAQCLNTNNIEEAERLLDSQTLQIDVQYIKSYYKGLIEKMKGNEDAALQWFERASQLNPVFWTAHIQCALLLHNKDPLKARRKYIRCAEILEKYIEEKSSKFDFLLESFSAEYFYAICTKNIEKGMHKCQ